VLDEDNEYREGREDDESNEFVRTTQMIVVQDISEKSEHF
jgi:hypothetical protein